MPTHQKNKVWAEACKFGERLRLFHCILWKIWKCLCCGYLCNCLRLSQH